MAVFFSKMEKNPESWSGQSATQPAEILLYFFMFSIGGSHLTFTFD